MIVTCPACTTRYLVDPRALGDAGRVVRCANCSKTWHQTPPEDLPRSLDVAPADVVPDFTTGRAQLPALPRRRGLPWATIAWAALIVIVLAGVIAGIATREEVRDEVVALWPPATQLYAMIGLGAQPPGIGIDETKTKLRRAMENGVPSVLVEGELVNSSQIARPVPALRIVLHDSEGNELQSLRVVVSEQQLLPGARIPFRTSIPQPNPAATSVRVTIGDGG